MRNVSWSDKHSIEVVVENEHSPVDEHDEVNAAPCSVQGPVPDNRVQHCHGWAYGDDRQCYDWAPVAQPPNLMEVLKCHKSWQELHPLNWKITCVFFGSVPEMNVRCATLFHCYLAKPAVHMFFVVYSVTRGSPGLESPGIFESPWSLQWWSPASFSVNICNIPSQWETQISPSVKEKLTYLNKLTCAMKF